MTGGTFDARARRALGVSHPGTALVEGPALIAIPYAVARALANRVTRVRRPALVSSGEGWSRQKREKMFGSHFSLDNLLETF